MGDINASKQYLQLPYTYAGRNGQGELHVLTKLKHANTTSSALLALDVEHLGYIETFVQKVNNQVSLQFRVEDDEILRKLAAHIPALVNQLTSAGYVLTTIAYKKSDERLGYMDALPDNDEKPMISRYSFDVRV